MAIRIPREPIGFRLCHELEGILHGIRADGRVVTDEFDRVVRWLAAAQPYRDLKPFSELIQHLDDALEDGVLTIDECDDLLFLTSKYTTVNPYFDGIRTGVQILHGLMTGMAADRAVPESEMKALQEWLETWEHLRGVWPYDECEALAVSAIGGSLDKSAEQYIIALAAQFPIGGYVGRTDDPPPLVGGICAVDPKIEFSGRTFVFTGESERWSRSSMETRVRNREGIPHPRVTQKTDYLVVCECGNPLWAFGCYGRKVEQAYNLRREGHPILIVREPDFWDAVQGTPRSRQH